MAINLGVIFSEIRLSLASLDEDAAAAKETLASVQEQLGATGGAAGAAASAGLEEAGAAASGLEGQVNAAREALAGAQTQLGATGAEASTAGAEMAATGEAAAAAGEETAAAGAKGGAGLAGLLGPLASVALSVEMVKQGFEFLKDKITDLIGAGEEANQVEAQTAAGLKSTHDASGETAASIGELADRVQNYSGIQADTVQSAENMLLTFENIGKDVFPQATQSVADLATKMANGAVPSQMQMQQAALQLGKALGDPTKGYAQLQRVGVTFTAQQIAQIKAMQKAGDTAGAQKIILAEMNKEFGGSAAAAGKANGGLAIFQARLETAKEKIGQGLIQALTKLQQAFAPLGALLMGGLVKALDWLIAHGDLVKSVLLGLAIALTVAVVPALWSMAAAAIAAETGFVPMAISIAAAAAPIIALGLAIGGLILFVKHLFDTNKGFHDLIANKVIPVLKLVASWIKDHVAAAIQAALPVVKQIIAHVQQFGQELSTRLGPALTNIGHFLGLVFGTYFKLVGLELQALQKVWNAVWPEIALVLQTAWNLIKSIVEIAWSIVSGIIKVGLDILGGNWKQAWTDIQQMFSGIWDGIKGALSAAWNAITGTILNGVKGILSALSHIPGPIGDMASKGLAALQKLTNGAKTQTADMAKGVSAHTLTMMQNSIMYTDMMRQKLVKEIKNTSDPAQKHALEMKLGVLNQTREMQVQALAHAKTLQVEHDKKMTLLRDQAKQRANETKEGVLGHFIDLNMQALSTLGTLKDNALGKLGALKDTAIQKAKDLVTDFMAALASLPGKMLTLGGDIVQGLLNGLKNAAGNLASGAKSLAGNLLGGIKNVFGIASPSKVMAEIGGFLSQGLIQGMQSVDVAAAAARHYGGVVGAAAASGAQGGALGGGASAGGGPYVDLRGLTVQVATESGDGTPEGAGTAFGQALGTALGPALSTALRQHGY